MLQLKALSAEAHEALAAREAFPPDWEDMAELERVADGWIAQARRVATTAFVSIDGKRSLNGLLAIVMFPTLTFQFALLHDAWISARKYYSRYELEHIPLIAAPGAAVSVTRAYPMNCLTVRFDQDTTG